MDFLAETNVGEDGLRIEILSAEACDHFHIFQNGEVGDDVIELEHKADGVAAILCQGAFPHVGYISAIDCDGT